MNYEFYIAQIVESATVDDNRLRVRILPQMEGIDSKKCPVYPSFFRDSLYMGKVGDYVWVLSDDEFSMGYVIGKANYNTYPDRTIVDGDSIYKESPSGTSLSIPDSLRSAINDSVSSVEMIQLSLSNAKVTYWDDNCIHYIEGSTGGKIIAFSNGTLYIMRPNEFIMKIGDSVINVGGGSISLSTPGPSEGLFSANNKGTGIKIQSNYVGLGKNPSANALKNDGKTAEGAIKSDYVFV